jgi:SH3 domain-containing YSC84-like protein 1
VARQLVIGLLLACCLASIARAAAKPDETVRSAAKVLSEIKTTPGKQIPDGLLAQAQAVVIVPDAIKFGLIGGVRSGYGVALLRQADGTWGLPQFVSLAGGSLGLQAGIEDIDMVLIFTTKRSAEGLKRGKFTVGTDASASAGPLGHDSTAVTDGRSTSEILAYSRSRGLFLGASIDGARLEIDRAACRAYYGAPSDQPAVILPAAATTLRDLVEMPAAVAKQIAGPRYDPPPKPGRMQPYRRMMSGSGIGAGT